MRALRNTLMMRNCGLPIFDGLPGALIYLVAKALTTMRFHYSTTREKLISDHLEKEFPTFGFLTLRRFDGAARRQLVLAIKLGIDQLREQLGRSRQALFLLLIAAMVVRLAENELAAVGVVAEIEPIIAIPIGHGLRNQPARLARSPRSR